jgi:predicted ribosomally synthesized peptide with SipW-like signal peptide
MKKIITLVLSLTMAVAIGVGGTLAWLTAETNAVKNTFTVGNIDIKLDEVAKDFKMVPGAKIEKDPKVTVEPGSEDCWLFVKVEKSTNLDAFMKYSPAEGWTALDNVPGVYYREVKNSDTIRSFDVLANNQVEVLGTVTKADMDTIKNDPSTAPTLTFTAYAVQTHGFGTAVKAWDEAKK